MSSDKTPEMMFEAEEDGIEYYVAEEDIIKPYQLSVAKTLYFSTDEDDTESDLLLSAAVWMQENKEFFDAVIGIDFMYYGDEPGAALALTVE